MHYLVAFIVLFGLASGLELFVSSFTGSDTNTGSLTSPLATLNGARSAQNRLSKKFDNSSTTIVSIRGGSYALWNSSLSQWAFDSIDSGFDAEHATIYQVCKMDNILIR